MAQEDSIRNAIRRLTVGECYSRSSRLELMSLTADDLAAERERLRNSMEPHVRHVRRENGMEYTVEVGEWFTRSRHVVITCLVTCIASNSGE